MTSFVCFTNYIIYYVYTFDTNVYHLSHLRFTRNATIQPMYVYKIVYMYTQDYICI